VRRNLIEPVYGLTPDPGRSGWRDRREMRVYQLLCFSHFNFSPYRVQVHLRGLKSIVVLLKSCHRCRGSAVIRGIANVVCRIFRLFFVDFGYRRLFTLVQFLDCQACEIFICHSTKG
jgi:hypothetical protein